MPTDSPEEKPQDSPSALEALRRLAERPGSFDRYQFEGEIARGGMGAILRVYDQDLQRHLAMKVILGQADAPSSGKTPPPDSRHVARFLEEAQVTSQLDHPGIVPVHEIGLDAKGGVYFTMKLVKGKTLKDVFDEMAAGQGDWNEPRVLGLILKVCEAMAYAHHKGVIHRDLKPANVMVGRFGEVYVMDWGLARLLDREDKKDLRVRPQPAGTSTLHSDRRALVGQSPDSPLVTMDGDVVGTPAYMSPEQAAGRVSEIGPQADVYAVGAMIYQMLSGQMPYVSAGARVNNYAIWQRVQEGPPQGIRKLAPNASAELVAICEKAMEREPNQRYLDMLMLAADVRAFVEHRVVSAYKTGSFAHALKWVERNKRFAAVAATASMAVIVGAIASIRLYATEAKLARLSEAYAALDPDFDPLRYAAGLLADGLESDPGSWIPSSVRDPETAPAFGSRLPRGWEVVDGTPGTDGWAMSVREPLSGIVFRLVPPGEFLRGSPKDEPGRGDNETRHAVHITKPFYLGETEVTVAQFLRKAGKPGGSDLPVAIAEWAQAKEFCLSIGCDLPTEAEWEYAARAKTQTSWWWGDSPAGGRGKANLFDGTAGREHKIAPEFPFDDGYTGLAPVGKFQPNGFGLFDMIGNVWEWCDDDYGGDYPERVLTDPRVQLAGQEKVLRGGSYATPQRQTRSACRLVSDGSVVKQDDLKRPPQTGFRVALRLP